MDYEKILTEQEMAEKRNAELQELQKKRTELSVPNKTPIADSYLKAHPEDYAFASYIRSLENAGMTEEHMKATGLWETIQSKISHTEKLEEQPVINGSIEEMLLSQSFRKHYMIVKGINDDILKNIEKMESFGHTPSQIVEELNLPNAMVEQLKQDIPSLNKIEEVVMSEKAM